jgi:hypothetical protein
MSKRAGVLGEDFRLGTRLVLNLVENYDITYRIQNNSKFYKNTAENFGQNPHSVVVRRPDSAIHQIVIFSSFVKSVVDWYNSSIKV